MTEIRLNAYRMMWLFVFFDLPVVTAVERRQAMLFRKNLEKDGFSMMQYSVYIRHCGSKESLDVHVQRVKGMIPKEGNVSILAVTDKQYSNIYNFTNVQKDHKKKVNIIRKEPVQLELF